MPKTIRTTCASLVPFAHNPDQLFEGVPDEVAAQMVALGNAYVVKDEGEDPLPLSLITQPGSTPSEVIEKLAQEYAPVLAAGPEGRDEDPESAVSSPGPEEPMKRPYGNATKPAWVRYALSVDPNLTEAAASEMSKVQLMTTYGERLLRLPRKTTSP